MGLWAEKQEARGEQGRGGAPVVSQPDPWPAGLGGYLQLEEGHEGS